MRSTAAPVLAPDTAPAIPKPPVVEVLSAEKVFGNGVRALEPISLKVEEGEFLTLLGPSGCGKSTLLKMVANLIEPSDGRLLWWRGGFDSVGRAERRLSFVFQEPTLMPWAKIVGNVRLPLDLQGVPRREGARRAAEALERVGLASFGGSFPRQLSGGMRMRASIARALVTEPNLLLMDEPFGALDEITRNKLDTDLVNLATERGLTTLFVTHSIYEAVFVSTRIVVMAARPGRIYKTLDIDEPMPRGDAFRTSPRFAAYCRDLSVWLAEASLLAATSEPGR